ncbi:hypothetical protein KSC_057640 [Ktedonobacter sp. SOSP1-52]|nr:hypothetical protein KSC_057640 [Ktedonobacter sp. SOSP1-52]
MDTVLFYTGRFCHKEVLEPRFFAHPGKLVLQQAATKAAIIDFELPASTVHMPGTRAKNDDVTWRK